jgi:ketosteroid isomerase-like protein
LAKVQHSCSFRLIGRACRFREGNDAPAARLHPRARDGAPGAGRGLGRLAPGAGQRRLRGLGRRLQQGQSQGRRRAFYAEDATFLPPTHDVIKGPAGVETFFAGLFSNGVTGHKLELIEVDVEGDDDEVVVAAAKWSADGKDANGAPATFGGVATHLFEKQDDGSLKLKLHTFN